MPNDNCDNSTTNPNELLEIPKWINADYFRPIVEKDVKNFKSIVKFTPIAATAPGDNYTSIMVRVVIDILLKDESKQQVSYILKTDLDSSQEGAALLKVLNFFNKETQMYTNFLPKFEQLYQEAGCTVQLGPKLLHYEETPERTTLVMEDLSRRNFVNMDRLKGLDMAHIHPLLHKLAELHAASAVYEEQNGPYADMFHYSFFNEANKAMMESMAESRTALFERAVVAWDLENVEQYFGRITSFEDSYVECIRINTVDPKEFNVLNHADMWTNNIMFAHNAKGEVEDACLVDFQVCKWGTPAQDLWYFCSTSVQQSLRVSEFDHIIYIYHKRLAECLRLLKYSKPIPSLKDIHIQMIKYSYWGLFTAITSAANVMFPKDNDATMESMVKEGPEGDEFRYKLYTAPIYTAFVKQWFPFLYNKGVFDIKRSSEK